MEADEHSAADRSREGDRAADQLRALAHGDDAEAAALSAAISAAIEAAHVVERGLRDFGDLAQLGAQRRSLRRLPAGAAQHRSDRGQDLAELVVELARDLAQRRLARRNQLLRQLVTAIRLIGELGE